MSQVVIRANFDAVYDQFESWADGQELTAGNVAVLVMKAMQLAQEVARTSGDKGAAKKELVMRLLKRLIQGSDRLDDDAKDVLLMIVENTVPAFIDGLVNADHGKLFEQGQRGLRRLIKKCGACCK